MLRIMLPSHGKQRVTRGDDAAGVVLRAGQVPRLYDSLNIRQNCPIFVRLRDSHRLGSQRSPQSLWSEIEHASSRKWDSRQMQVVANSTIGAKPAASPHQQQPLPAA
jgi:hypothetical protein